MLQNHDKEWMKNSRPHSSSNTFSSQGGRWLYWGMEQRNKEAGGYNYDMEGSDKTNGLKNASFSKSARDCSTRLRDGIYLEKTTSGSLRAWSLLAEHLKLILLASGTKITVTVSITQV